MTHLEFNYSKISEIDVGDIPTEYFLSTLTETCFLIPVRLLVNNVDVFQIEYQQIYIDLPAFDILLNWKDKLDSLKFKTSIRIILPGVGEMLIERSNENIKLYNNFNKIVVISKYVEFISSMFNSINELDIYIKSTFSQVYIQAKNSLY